MKLKQFLYTPTYGVVILTKKTTESLIIETPSGTETIDKNAPGLVFLKDFDLDLAVPVENLLPSQALSLLQGRS